VRSSYRAGVTVAFVITLICHPHRINDSELDIGAIEATERIATPRIETEPPAGLTREDWSQIRKAVENSGYHANRVISPEGSVLLAPNRQQAYRTKFRREGIEIVPGGTQGHSWRLRLSVRAYGYEGAVRPLADAEPTAEKERVEYRRGPVTEWYANRPEGLEQGFTLEEPKPRRAGPMVIAMTVQGDLEISAGDEGALFADPSGALRLRYAGLKAWDAEGLPLRARIEAADREMRLVVETQRARFPVTVDPTFVHEAQLLGHGDPVGQQAAEFGYSVSASGDTVVVGARLDRLDTLPVTGAAFVFARSGTTWTQQQRLVAPDGEEFDNFGWSVSLSGNTVVVGAPFDDTPGGTDAGSAYVFVQSGTTWSFQQKLVAPDGGFDDRFGSSVSLSGETVIIGAPFDAALAGSAYVFVRSGTTWAQQQKLTASDGAFGDLFGGSVSLSGDTFVAGARMDDNAAGLDAGSAYVFARSGSAWTQQQKLLASDGGPGDNFGAGVSVEADTTVVGAALDDTPAGVDAGSSYVFVRSGTTWSEQQKLLASDALANDNFGSSASLFGDSVVVGSPRNLNTGAAYVFVRSGMVWSEQQKLVALDPAGGDNFASSVTISGNTVMAGANLDDTPGGFEAGSAYAFVRSGVTWTQQQKLMSLDVMDGDTLGASVSVSGDTVVVGAPVDDTAGGFDAGSAYVFVRTATTWTEQQKLVAADGTESDLFGTSVAVSGDTLVVGAQFDGNPGGVPVGSAYVFVRSGTTWSQQQELRASDGAFGDAFGSAVSVSGDTIVVGASGDDIAAEADVGSAYVFVRSGTTWTEQQKLLAADGVVNNQLGSSVSFAGDTAVVGAPSPVIFGDTGKAYVFVRTGTVWTQQQKLLASDGALNDRFGNSVTLWGDTVVIGAPLDDTAAGVDAGSAYVIVRAGTTWTEQQKLLPPDGAAGDRFGVSVSALGDTVVVGAELDDTQGGSDAGSAYVFARSGSNWISQQKLLAPDGGQDRFGHSVSLSGTTVVVGAPSDTFVPGVFGAGSAHVFRDVDPQADLGVTKTDGQTTVMPGETLTYAIAVVNAGPTAVIGATVTDLVPSALQGAAWTCSASPGSSCAAGGSGNINQTVNLLAGGTATFALTATLDPAATGSLVNTATVAPPSGVSDPNPGNNSATDIDAIIRPADLGIAKTDSADPVSIGDPLSYTLAIGNLGPFDAAGVVVLDTLPTGVTFVSSAPGFPTCSLSGPILTCALGSLAAGSNVGVTINTTVNASGGILVNTATVAGAETDPEPSNNSASAATAVGSRDGELAHGTDGLYDLAAQPGPAVDEDVFRINQKPHSSYEVVVDATSGDIGAGSGPLLERIGPDGTTVLQGSSPTGTGSSRSLRWRNTTAAEVEGEVVRVRSAGCGTDCGPDDVYRIRAYETTYAVPRFNNAGTQITVLILQNPSNYPMAGDVYFRISSGALVAVEPFSLSPKETLILNTAAVPGAAGVAGALTVAHDGRYGDLAGKTVALEPATGFSFDSPLVPRLR
jgi:uncharacterized repeat protein (TIGR01451 family)